MTPREWWKRYYRAQRISRRECLKAAEDMLTLGTGGVLVSVINGEVTVEHLSPDRYLRPPEPPTGPADAP